MKKSPSSTSSTPNKASNNSKTGPINNIAHSIKWWSIKLFSGTSLIAALFLKMIYDLPSQIQFPIVWAQVLVITGGLTSLLHYCYLKRKSNDISQPNQLIRRFGLFKVIRHPMYFGDVLTYLGLFLMFPNSVSAIILLFAIIAIVKQSGVEDAFMASQFAEHHAAWKDKTKRVFPFIY